MFWTLKWAWIFVKHIDDMWQTLNLDSFSLEIAFNNHASLHLSFVTIFFLFLTRKNNNNALKGTVTKMLHILEHFDNVGFWEWPSILLHTRLHL